MFKFESKSLKYTLIFGIVLASSLITAFFTVISFYIDFKEEKGLIQQVITQVEKANLNNISTALWSYELDNLSIQVNGILSIHDVVQVKVTDSTGAEKINKAKNNIEPIWLKHQSFDLFKDKQKMGKMELWLTLDNMYFRLGRKVIYFFVTQFLKTSIASFIMLLIFNYYIFRHIVILDQYFKKIDKKSLKSLRTFISIPFKEHQSNELTRLRDQINEMLKRLKKNDEDLQLEISQAKNVNFNLLESQSRLDLISNLGPETEHSVAGVRSGLENIKRRLNDNPDGMADVQRTLDSFSLIVANLERTNWIITGDTGAKKSSFESICAYWDKALKLAQGDDIKVDLVITNDDKSSNVSKFPWLDIVIENMLKNSLTKMSEGSIHLDFASDDKSLKIIYWYNTPRYEKQHFSNILEEYNPTNDPDYFFLKGSINMSLKMIDMAKGKIQSDPEHGPGEKYVITLPLKKI